MPGAIMPRSLRPSARAAFTVTPRSAAEIGELVGMELDGKAELARRLEDLRRLGDREGDFFAEGIDGVGEIVASDGGQHLVADELDIAGARILVFGRNGMRAEEAR